MADVQDLILEKLNRIEDKLDCLPCTDHAVRIKTSEVKVKELNDIRQLVRSTIVKWGLPVLLGGLAGGSFLHNLFS